MPTLVVLAAGLGTRFGGDKQTTALGPGGATLLEYGAYDALRAGFGRVVVVVRAERQRDVENSLRARLHGRLPLVCVVQRPDALPTGSVAHQGRTKPWGTAHAVLAARGAVHEPFAVANADDFYGRESFTVLAAFLASAGDATPPSYALVGFPLGATLSDSGPVNRALCETNTEGWLERITERRALTRAAVDAEGVRDTLVSMNLWAFTPTIFPQLEQGFIAFLRAHGADEHAEYLLPTAIQELVSTQRARVQLLPTPGRWCGVTYAPDAPRASAFLAELTARGEYPRDLWA